jgi:predicted KAP-like P-loop ATPase
MRFFLTGKKEDSCLKFKIERILTDQQEKQESKKNYKIFRKSLSFRQDSFDRKETRLLSDQQDNCLTMTLHKLYIYIDVYTLFSHFHATINGYYVQLNKQKAFFQVMDKLHMNIR